MDKRILISMLIIILFAGIILGIKMCNKECIPPEITVVPEQPFMRNVVTFKTNSDEDEKITWNFGDGESFTGNEAKHKYDSSATFIVIAKLEDNCEAQKVIFIKELPKMHAAIFAVNLPSPIRAKEPATFSDATMDATEWHWKVKETGETGEKPLFSPVFPKKGIYNITLSVNGAYVQGDTAFKVMVAGAIPAVKNVPSSMPNQEVYVPPPQRPEPKKVDETPMEPERNYLPEYDFKAKFIEVANNLNNRIVGASDEWKNTIVPEGCDSTMKVEVIFDSSDPTSTMSESWELGMFKRNILFQQYRTIKEVIKVERKNKKCITKVHVVVEAK